VSMVNGASMVNGLQFAVKDLRCGQFRVRGLEGLSPHGCRV